LVYSLQWSSDALYGGRVSAAPVVASHTLAGLPTVVLPEDGVVTLSSATLCAARSAAAADISDRIAEAEDAAAVAAEAAATSSKPGAGGAKRAACGVAAPPSDRTLTAVRDLLLPSTSDVILETAALLSPMLLVDTAGE
jgi:hypothetical protein